MDVFSYIQAETLKLPLNHFPLSSDYFSSNLGSINSLVKTEYKSSFCSAEATAAAKAS